ncbi:ABC transporter permease [Psychromonas sp. KJ10-10]|uniref:ABC transporter permease n=1 Tax=Psychromonas sp. KJ10-10 TaxID=3391823 RepID=UPI0039B48373
MLVMPILALVMSAFSVDENGSFQHIIDTVLWDYTFTTLNVIAGVMLVSFCFALPSAWFIACCKFPSRQTLQWALMLPLALPPYIIAIVYTDLLDFSGPVQHFIRNLMDWKLVSDYYFPDIRTVNGAILILSLSLYPYLYLLLRGAFLSQSGGLFQATKKLRFITSTGI